MQQQTHFRRCTLAGGGRQSVTQAAASAANNLLGFGGTSEESFHIHQLERIHLKHLTSSPKILQITQGDFNWDHFRRKIETAHFGIKAFNFSEMSLTLAKQIIIQSNHAVLHQVTRAAGSFVDQYPNHALCSMTHIKEKPPIIELIPFSALQAQTPKAEIISTQTAGFTIQPPVHLMVSEQFGRGCSPVSVKSCAEELNQVLILHN